MANQYITLSIFSKEEVILADTTTRSRYVKQLTNSIKRMFEASFPRATGDAGGENIIVIDGASSAVAYNTITFSDHATANDTITVGAITFTGKSSASSSTEFTVGTTATATAANLAAKINAHATTGAAVSASSALGVLTISSLLYGAGGNIIPLAASCSVATIGGSGVALENGGTSTVSTFI